LVGPCGKLSLALCSVPPYAASIRGPPSSYPAPSRKGNNAHANGGVRYQFDEMSYFFSTPVDIDIVLEDGDDRQMVDMKTEKNRREKAPLYKDGESVKGAVTIRPKDGKRLEHTGIKVQFIGTIGRFRRIPLKLCVLELTANHRNVL